MLPSKDEILNRTNYGLDVILHYYPEAQDCVDKKKHFKIRDERTSSAYLKLVTSNSGEQKYVVTDFGDDSKAMDCFAVVMREENCDFAEALKIIGTTFGIISEKDLEKVLKPEFSTRKKNPDEKPGELIFHFKADWTEQELSHIFSRKIMAGAVSDWKQYNKDKDLDKDKAYQSLTAVLSKYHIHNIDFYEKVKEDGTVLITKSTPDYPIFCLEQPTFKKILQPASPNKQYRFFYHGTRPRDFVNGYSQLCKAYEQEQQKLADMEDEERKGKSGKVPTAVLCSGERDALNVAACGYEVLWLNSETADLPPKIFGSIMQKVEKLCNCPDIDATGLREAHQLALTYLDIRTIELPKWLLKKRDFRGKAKKDVRDYLDFCSRKDFNKLVDCALPYRFWEEYKTKTGYNYRFDNVCAYNFLEKCGYLLHKSENDKDGAIFIKIEGNVVSKIRWNDIARFIHDFLREREFANRTLRNVFMNSNRISEASFRHLKEVDLDFTDYARDTQMMFFANEDWVVSRKGIEVKPKQSYSGRFVWEDQVVQHKVEVLDPAFTIKKDDLGKWHVTINRKDCLYLQFLINTCRMHWRTERERLKGKPLEFRKQYLEDNKATLDGELLTEAEIQEHYAHFANRIFTVGYLMHRYKSASRPWAVWAMENKVDEEGESSGGSGKSLTYSLLDYYKKVVMVPGRNKDRTEDKHIYGEVDKNTALIIIDDCHKYLDFGIFFPHITGSMDINVKFGAAYTLPFEQSPKLIFTSNYPVRNLDGSTRRRLIFSVYSDYYHHIKTNEQSSEHKPKDDFGKDLFKDFNEQEWNEASNTIARCLEFYLKQDDKVNPPIDEIEKRALRQQIGDLFLEWADSFFRPGEDDTQCDKLLPKPFILDHFTKNSKAGKWNSHRFTKTLKMYAELYGLEFNPEELQNSQGRISRKWVPTFSNSNKQETADFVYLKTPGKPVSEENSFADNDNSDSTDLGTMEEDPTF